MEPITTRLSVGDDDDARGCVQQLIAALARSAPEVRVTGMSAGLQAVLELPAGTESGVLRAAARRGLMVSGMAQFRHEALPSSVPAPDALVVNYSAVSDSAWEQVLSALCGVLP
jgi:GntR family transcriptional regulator / MocR family aminotransferase